MASRKLTRDLLLSHNHHIFRRPLFFQLGTNIRIIHRNFNTNTRPLSVLNEFSKQLQGEATCNEEFQLSIKELKERKEALKGVTEDIKARTKLTTEKLFKQVDGVWTEAEATAKMVSATFQETISSAKEEVKETFGFGKKEPSSSLGTSFESGNGRKSESTQASGEENKPFGPSDTAGTLIAMLRSGLSSAYPVFSTAFKKLKDTRATNFAKMGYQIFKDELVSTPKRRKPLNYPSPGERSDRMEIVVIPLKQSKWGKMWDNFMDKTRSHRVFKHVGKISKPVVQKSQEFVEDVQERWETSDNPVVHKIQDLNESFFGENVSAHTLKEIRSRDPAFSLLDFVEEVQETIRPILNAFIKADDKILRKYCSQHVTERCLAQHKAYESNGIFFDKKFQTQQVHCVRDRKGSITEGSKDTIHTVHYLWAMEQMDPEDVGEDAVYAMWRLTNIEMIGVQTLI